ncbi:MAG: zinc finger domain-containing protein [Promethearchaeota archaeon]
MPIIECKTCSGTGKYVRLEQCPNCKGLGSTRITLGENQDVDKDACENCGGKGKIQVENPCQRCEGTGEVWECLLCGLQRSFPKDKYDKVSQVELCERCEENPVVYHLIAPFDRNLVRGGRRLQGKVVSVDSPDVIVELAPDIEGIIRKETLKTELNLGEMIVTRVVKVDNRNIELVHVPIKDFRLQDLYSKRRVTKVRSIPQIPVGQNVNLIAEISGVKQTSGPILFSFTDETGTIQGVSFEEDRRYLLDFEVGMVVDVSGRHIIHRGTDQVEIGNIRESAEKDVEEFRSRFEKRIDDLSRPDLSVGFLIESPNLENMKPAIISIAKRIRRAVFEQQKIIIRHHMDVDGFCGGMALEFAVRSLLLREGLDEENFRRRVQRQISRVPYYGEGDVIRDLNFAMDEVARFGTKIPLLVLVDIGSSYESQLSYNICEVYSQEVLVIDHHSPIEEVKELVKEIVNPYFAQSDYSITAGMISVEIARFINPKISGRVLHLPAVSGVADHMQSPELDKYIKLVEENRYPKEFVHQIVKALNYFLYHLRGGDGGIIVSDIIGISGDKEQHRKLVELLSVEFEKAILSALEVALAHIEKLTLKNQIQLYLFDVELFARSREFPPPGKLAGALHDYFVNQDPEEKIVTFGYGLDFGIIRSTGLNLDFPKLMNDLQQELPTSGVVGGGHLDVGSLRFIEASRGEVMQKLAEKLADIE